MITDCRWLTQPRVDHEDEHRHEQRDRRHDHQGDARREEDPVAAEAPEDDGVGGEQRASASRPRPTRRVTRKLFHIQRGSGWSKMIERSELNVGCVGKPVGSSW